MPASMYTTRQALLDAGVPVGDWEAARITGLIRAQSSVLDRICGGLRFIAYEESVTLDGSGTPSIERANRMPVLSVSSIALDSTRNTEEVWPDERPAYMGGRESISSVDDYVLRPDGLAREIVTPRGVWPLGVGNVQVTGVWGWVHEPSVKALSTTLGAELAASSEEVVLAGALAGLQPRDVLTIGSVVAVPAKAIEGATISIDTIAGAFSAPLAVNTPVRVYGAVPPEVEMYVVQLCAREVARIDARRNSFAGSLDQLRFIKLDGFEAGFHQVGGALGASAASALMLGIPEYDAMLAALLEGGGCALQV